MDLHNEVDRPLSQRANEIHGSVPAGFKMRFRQGLCVGSVLFSLVAARGQKPDISIADKEAFQRVCGECHTTSMIDGYRSMPDWRQTVDNMMEIGARGTPEDMVRVMRYLARSWTRINLNAATAEDIVAVLGIKEDLARAVVKYRTEHGHFTAIGELKKVPGFEKIKPDEYKDKFVVSGQGEEKR